MCLAHISGAVMLTEPEENEHGTSSAGVRLLHVERQRNCGFHLTRSKWDPYPWVSAVDAGTAADTAGIRPGDCVLEVNGEDVLGRRVGEIAEVVRARPDQVSLLLWNAGVDPHCTPENLCCGPMPSNMQRLSTCLSSILSVMECPVCLDTIPPPANQCVNGHLICLRCHAKSERCPVCRIRLSRGRSLFADQVYNSLVEAFELSKESNDQERTAKLNEIFRLRKKKKNPEIKITQSHTNRFLQQSVEKASSAENLLNQFLMPKLFGNEFNSDLRAKSLSTSEIFSPSSSGTPSRTVFRDGNKSNISRTRFDRSFESLNGDLYVNKSNTSLSYKINELLYYCPFHVTCNERIKENMITKHFQEAHEGPFVQYFKCKLTFNLLNSHNDTYCILHNTDKQFFLKIDVASEKNSNRTDNFNDILIWMWFMGNQTIANEYQMQLHVYHSSCPEKLLLSLNSAIYSLSTLSWKDIKTSQKGVFLSSTTLKALDLNKSDIILDLEIIHNTFLAMMKISLNVEEKYFMKNRNID